MEIPASTKPEQAWLTTDTLIIDYHDWHTESYNYIDKTLRIPRREVRHMEMVYGPNGGFKEMRLIHGNYETFRLSKNHEEVIIQIYKLVRHLGAPVNKIGVPRKKKGGELN